MKNGFMTPVERTRRFWAVHGRTTDYMTSLHAFCNNPKVAWTPEGLSVWYGVRVDRARAIVAEFAGCGIVRSVAGPGRGFRWNPAHDFAVPRTSAGRDVVRERWLGLHAATGRSAT